MTVLESNLNSIKEANKNLQSNSYKDYEKQDVNLLSSMALDKEQLHS